MRISFLRLTMALVAIVIFTIPALASRTLNMSSGQKVYVPIYQHIYQGPKSRPYNLSALLSIRNVSVKMSITITSVQFYNSTGTMVRNFFDTPIVIPPMGTKEVFLPERDHTGGSGANFTVRWESSTKVATPIIQAVMIGTASTQGISFVCDGVVIEDN